MFSNTKINSLVAFKKTNANIHKTKTLTSTRPTPTKLTNAPVYNSGRPRTTGKSVGKRHDDSVSLPKADEKKANNGNAAGGASMTSTFVAALTERSGARARRERESLFNKKTSTNRADRLQVRLNMLELEIGRLQQKEKQLEQRLSRFMVQRSTLSSTIDDLHLRLDTLTCNHKSLARKDSPQRRP